MTPREMVLNHASVYAQSVSRGCVSNWLRDIVKGVTALQGRQVVGSGWRMSKLPPEIVCQPGYTLWDAFLELRNSGHRDDYAFLAGLSARTPLLGGVPSDVRSRYLGCEGLSLTPEEGDPLLLCAIWDSVAVGLPSESAWDKDRVTVEFRELLPDESWADGTEQIDNLTRLAHADPIFRRHQERSARSMDFQSLWASRKKVFPDLMFGPGVEGNLEKEANKLPAIVGKLIDLDRAAADWQAGPAPKWRSHVTDESQSVRQNPKLSKERRFRSQDGTTRLFNWHARVGGDVRIHFRIDGVKGEVEIGYIGSHRRLS